MIIKNVRLSYVQLFEPKAQGEGGVPRYSCVILIDKNDKATIDAEEAAVAEVVAATEQAATAAAEKVEAAAEAQAE